MKYNTRYKCYVSKDGLVYGIKNDRLVLRSLKPFPNKKYIRVYVWDYEANKNVSKRLHRLVWETFNGEIPEGMQIDHIDGNKENNALNNLRCVDAKTNSNNPNTVWKLQGKNNGMYGHEHTVNSKRKISANKSNYLTVYGMTCTEIAEVLNITPSAVSSAHKNNTLKEKLLWVSRV